MNILIVGSGLNTEAPGWAEYFASSDKIDRVYMYCTTPYQSNCMNPKVNHLNILQLNNITYDYYLCLDPKALSQIKFKLCPNAIVIGCDNSIAKLELDKSYFKTVCNEKGVLSPKRLFEGNANQCLENIQIDFPIIIKPSTEFMGVKTNIYPDLASAINFLNKMNARSSNDIFIIEEYIDNAIHVEVCFVADGKDLYSLGTSAEYKNWLGTGANKGGWVNYSISPSNLVTKELEYDLLLRMKVIFGESIPKGIFCVQGLATKDRLYLMELNARPGGSEIVTVWNKTDPFEFLTHITNGTFEKCELKLLDHIGKYYGLYTIINKSRQAVLINLPKDNDNIVLAPYNVFKLSGNYFSCNNDFPIMLGIIGDSEKEVRALAKEYIPEIFNKQYFDYDID